jgi:hypothetical protein
MPAQKNFTQRMGLILLALLAGGAVPVQLITLSFGYAQNIKHMTLGPKVIMTAHTFAKPYIWWVYVPAIIVLIAVVAYTRRRYPDIHRRIVVGFSMGAVATVALDAVRQAGVIHGWLPGDTAVMFGKMATGSNNFSFFYPAGLLVHYLNGADFGLVYAFIWGKRAHYWAAVGWATVWALIVELGMMLGPPMGPMVGLFGVRYAWPQLFLLTLVAHIAFGIALGLLVQTFLKDVDRSGLWHFLKGNAKRRDTIARIAQV